jgi:hypothetical protein
VLTVGFIDASIMLSSFMVLSMRWCLLCIVCERAKYNEWNNRVDVDCADVSRLSRTVEEHGGSHFESHIMITRMPSVRRTAIPYILDYLRTSRLDLADCFLSFVKKAHGQAPPFSHHSIRQLGEEGAKRNKKHYFHSTVKVSK